MSFSRNFNRRIWNFVVVVVVDRFRMKKRNNVRVMEVVWILVKMVRIIYDIGMKYVCMNFVYGKVMIIYIVLYFVSCLWKNNVSMMIVILFMNKLKFY